MDENQDPIPTGPVVGTKAPILGTYLANITLRGEGGVEPIELGTVESLISEALEGLYGGGVTANVRASRTDI